MKHIITYIRAMVLIIFATFVTSAEQNFEENAPPSLADHLHLTRSKDPVDRGWLADLIGLPNKDQVNVLTRQVAELMLEDKDTKCKSINWQLRMIIFQHFAIYQQMANAQHVYFDKKIAHQWAHILGMILKESSGDTTNITDFRGHSISTYMPKTDLQHWRQILNLSGKTAVQLNFQTNFGLTQTSTDRLFIIFKLLKDQAYDTAFLEGLEGADTPRKIGLNTAIAIRRLIWFYQDFAQGRILQSNPRIHQPDINNPALSARWNMGLKMALMYCGTSFMFKEGQQNMTELEKAMASIAYCKLGNSQAGYGVSEAEEKCFAEWVTLCPALNIDIAMLTPLIYFHTRFEPPVCEDTFNQLIIQKPDEDEHVENHSTSRGDIFSFQSL